MRKWLAFITLGISLPFFAYAQSATTTSSGATVTYSPSTELSCPANSTLQGAQCYCYRGYVVSGNSCVPYVPPPPPAAPTNTIYNDVLMSLTVNDDKSCTELFLVKADADMCAAYRAATDKGSWKTIERPATSATNAPAIANPWAPASSQTFSSSADVNGTGTTTPQIVLATVVTPPPPPEATSTADATSSDDAAAKALEKLVSTPVPDPTPAPDPTPPPPPPPPPPPAPEPDPAPVLPPEQVQPAVIDPDQAANAAAAEAANMPQLPPGLTPITNDPPKSDTSLTDDQKIPDDTAATPQPGFFAKIFGWLFGWL